MTVTRWTGHDAKLLRAALRMSLRDFSAHLGIATRTVSNWEKLGTNTVPQPTTQAILDTALDRSSDDVKARFRLLAEEAAVKRRELFASVGVSLVATTPTGRIGLSDAKRLHGIADRFTSLDQQFGSETLWQVAYAITQDGLKILEHGSYTDSVGRELVQATGRIMMKSGWLAFDAGRHDIARHCYNETLNLTRQQNDPILTTMAFSNLGFQANKLRRPREALRFAEAAESSAQGPLVEVIPALRRISAAGIMGDTRSAERAIAAARAVFERDADKEVDSWLSFLTPAELDGVEAACQGNLGRHQRAANLLEQAIKGLDDSFARNRALYQVRLARLRLDIGERDGAIEAAKDAQGSLDAGVSSSRVRTGLDEVLRRLEHR